MTRLAVQWLLAASLPLLAMGADKSSLRITSACATEPMWIAHMAAASPGPDPQNIKLEPLQSHDMTVYPGLAATRYWPKFRCNAEGNSCKVGGSGGPGEACETTSGCAPAVDTKFEATFGSANMPCDASADSINGSPGCDFIDVSLVDGFTVGFKLKIQDCKFTTRNSTGHRTLKSAPSLIDCSKIDMANCPTAEDMGQAGTHSLVVKNPNSGTDAGCYSPCSKLTFAQWNNPTAKGHSPQDDTCKEYCCPTPPESADACRKGPVNSTKFVEAVHSMCPGVYGYSYDDGIGLMSCPRGTQYEMIFYCPTNSTQPSSPPTTVWT
jgi:hypothetical protein